MTAINTRGLTLIELLAALIILSSVVAAAVAVQRDVRDSASNHAAQLQSQVVLDQWIAAGRPGPAWEYSADDGSRWRVHVDGAEGVSSPRPVSQKLTPPPLPAHWQTVVVQHFIQGEFSDIIMMQSLAADSREIPSAEASR